MDAVYARDLDMQSYRGNQGFPVLCTVLDSPYKETACPIPLDEALCKNFCERLRQRTNVQEA